MPKSIFIYRFCKFSVIQGSGLITSVVCVRFVSFSALVKVSVRNYEECKWNIRLGHEKVKGNSA